MTVRLCLVFRKPNLQNAEAVVYYAAGACLVYQMLLELIMKKVRKWMKEIWFVRTYLSQGRV